MTARDEGVIPQDPPPRLGQASCPCCMVGQAWPEARTEPFATLRALENQYAEGFFEGFQISDCPHVEERRAIGAFVRASGVSIDYSLGQRFYAEGWRLATESASERAWILNALRMHFDEAREVGAQYVLILSGPGPERAEERPAALAALGRMLEVLDAEAAREPALSVLIEPLDVASHKRGALGYTHEAMELLAGLRQFELVFDTAHVVLNGEDLDASFNQALPRIGELHLCNCVADPSNPEYGDWHPLWGPPGWLTLDRAAAVMCRAWELGYLRPGGASRIALEAKRPEGMPGAWLAAYSRTQLEGAWALARASLCEPHGVSLRST